MDGDCSHETKRCLLLERRTMINLDSILKSRDINLLKKVCSVKTLIFSSSHVQIWELGHKEDWAPKNWGFWTVVLETTIESPLDSKENKLVNPRRNQTWIFIGKTDVEAGALIFGHLMQRANSLEKTLMLGKAEGRRRMGWQNEMVGWHHRLNAQEYEQTVGQSEGQGSQEFCSPWGHSQTQLSNWIIMNSIILCPERITLSDFFSRKKKRQDFLCFLVIAKYKYKNLLL